MTPPGETTNVVARRALVLAPHYDDEVLGCGGLLAHLGRSGCDVQVLFLSDSSGGREDAETAADYGRIRRRESEAAARVLGIGGAHHLGLPDGALDQYRTDLCAAIGSRLEDLRPDLLLVPSPLEVTADHRASFAAVHDLLGALRRGDELEATTRDLEILLYEVNHPGYPDLLVDISEEVATLEEAMSHYGSQQQRHDYLAAALGLRRYRTLSLPPEIRAAEGFRRLRLDDFTTRSPSQLLRHLGAVSEMVRVESGPLVSVVVRTRDRPDLLREALASLAEGVYRRVEIVLVNDGGRSPELADEMPFELTQIDLPENRGRAAAANAGVAAATGDCVAFLDDDDTAAPEHLATLVEGFAGADVDVVYSDAAVGVYELGKGSGWTCVERRLPYSRDFDGDLLLLDNYIPFNSLLIARERFREVGDFDPELAILEDWDFLIRLSQVTPFHHLPIVTCEYRHFRGGGAHHALAGSSRSRPGYQEDFLAAKALVLHKHGDLLAPERLAAAVDRLRFELVAASEEAAASGRARRRLEAGLAEEQSRYHRRNGELVSLRKEHERLVADLERDRRLLVERAEAIGDRDRLIEERQAHIEHLDAELARLYADEKALRVTVDEQTEHLGRTYEEIERLNRLIHDIESMRGVRWQRSVERFLKRTP